MGLGGSGMEMVGGLQGSGLEFVGDVKGGEGWQGGW